MTDTRKYSDPQAGFAGRMDANRPPEGTLLRYARLYAHFFAQNLKTKLEYRLDFVLGIAATLLQQLVGIAFIGIVFMRITDVRGWGVYEVALIYGLAGAARGINEFLFDNVWYMSWIYVREGKFDHLLHRPVQPLFHLLADRVETHGIGSLALGLTITFVSWANLGIPFTAGRVAFLAVILLSGAVIHFAINLTITSISFWLIDMRHLLSTIDSFSFLGKYPITIYPRFIQTVITWILPYAFVAFFPAALIIGKAGYVGMGLASPLVAAAALAGSIWVFHRGLSVYESTGT